MLSEQQRTLVLGAVLIVLILVGCVADIMHSTPQEFDYVPTVEN